MPPKSLLAPLKSDHMATASKPSTRGGSTFLEGSDTTAAALDGGTSPFRALPPSANVNVLSSTSLSPPIIRTPKKQTPGAKNAAVKPMALTIESACRAVKADILFAQCILDAEATVRPTLSMRQLENELFRVDGTPSHEDRLVQLLEVLARKSSELAEFKNGGGGGGSSTEQQPVTSVIGKLMRLLPSAPIPPSSVLSEIERCLNPSPQATTNNVASVPEQSAAVIASDATMMIGRKSLNTSHDATAVESATTPAATPLSVSAAELPFGGHQKSVAGPVAAPAPKPPLTADTKTMLGRLGIEVSGTTADDIDIDAVVRRLIATARSLHTAQLQVEHRLRATSDVHQQTTQRLHLEIDALRAKLVEREHQLEELKQQTSGSRFAPNVHRSLVTVNDAPMSFEVEKGYQRELKFAGDRIKELEDAYARLLDDGKGDRDRVKQLTAEVSKRDDAINDLKKTIAKTESEREEQRQLFLGVSRTRGEEARMSLVAVKQLESRVESLSEQLQTKTSEADNYLKSLRALYILWVSTEDKLKATKEQLRELEMEHHAYKNVYNNSLSDELFVVQDELVKALSLADQREATVMIQRQQLDDVDVLRNLSNHESQLWMERLKASNEWKVLTVKAPEETKQLAVRLLMLTGDKEKKEAAMTASQNERLNVFRARAEKEINERLLRHQQHVDMKQPAQHQDDLRMLLDAAADQRRKEDEENEELHLPPKMSALEDYLQEAAKRPSDPRMFFSQWLELRAQQQQQLLASLGR